MIKANKDTMLMETSILGSTIKAAAKEIGIPRVTQKARRRFMKNPSNRLTSSSPMAMFVSSKFNRLFRISDRSE